MRRTGGAVAGRGAKSCGLRRDALDCGRGGDEGVAIIRSAGRIGPIGAVDHFGQLGVRWSGWQGEGLGEGLWLRGRGGCLLGVPQTGRGVRPNDFDEEIVSKSLEFWRARGISEQRTRGGQRKERKREREDTNRHSANGSNGSSSI